MNRTAGWSRRLRWDVAPTCPRSPAPSRSSQDPIPHLSPVPNWWSTEDSWRTELSGLAQLAESFGRDRLEHLQIIGEHRLGYVPVQHQLGEAEVGAFTGPVHEGAHRREGVGGRGVMYEHSVEICDVAPE